MRFLLLVFLLAAIQIQAANPTITKSVDTIADLKALLTSDKHDTVNVRGYLTVNDGGQGTFEFIPGSTDPDDGGINVAPNLGTGRWRRVVPGRTYLARWWGPSRTNATVQSAIDWVSANGYGNVDVDGGVWTVKTDDSTRITMKSGVTLRTAEDSTIIAAPNPTNNWILIDFPIGASDCGVGPARLIGWNLIAPGGDTNKSGLIFSMQDTTNVVIGGVKADNWYTQYADVGSGNVNLKMLDVNWQPTIRALGVMGDGRDDTKNWQAALDYAERYDQRVRVPWTTNGYLITTPWITNGVGLVIEGEGKPTINMYYSNPTEGVLPHYSGFMVSAANCVFRGLKFKTVGSFPVTETNAIVSGFFIPINIHTGATNTLIEDCEFEVESGKGINIGGSNTKIKDCLFIRCGLTAGLDNADNWLWYEDVSPNKGQKYSPLSPTIINNTFIGGTPYKYTVHLSASDDFLFQGNRMLDMNTACPLFIYTGDEGTTDIRGTNVYGFGGKVLDNTITGTNFGFNGAIYLSISTPTNYVAPTFDPYDMYSTVLIANNHIIGTGTYSNCHGLYLLSARDTRIGGNHVQVTGSPLWLVGNNNRLLIERNYMESTVRGLGSTIVSSDGFLQPGSFVDMVFRQNKIFSAAGEEFAIRNVEPLFWKNVTIFDNDFDFKGELASGLTPTDAPKVIQLTKSQGYINIVHNDFYLTNAMSYRRILYIEGTNADVALRFNKAPPRDGTTVFLQGGTVLARTVEVEGNNIGSMEFSATDLLVRGNIFNSNTNSPIPLDITATERAIVSGNIISNSSPISSLVAVIGATNAVFEHNTVVGNSSSDIVRSTVGEMLVGNNIFENSGGGLTYANATGSGTISHYIYKHAIHLDIPAAEGAYPLTIRRAGFPHATKFGLDNHFFSSSRDALYYSEPDTATDMAGHAFFVHKTDGTFQYAFGAHGSTPPIVYIGDPTNSMQLRIGAGTVAYSSLLRTDSSGNVSPVAIGANLTFDGTTLAAGSGSGASGLAGTLSATRIPVATGPTNLIDSPISIVDTNAVLRRNNTAGIYYIVSNTLSATRFGQSGVTGIIETEAAGSSIQFASAGVQLYEFGPGSFGPFTDAAVDLGTGVKRVKTAYIRDSIVLGAPNIASTISVGGGNPETVVSGRPGDIFIRTNGFSSNIIYVKESGVATTSGWHSYTASGYNMDFVCDSSNPADSLTYYAGMDAGGSLIGTYTIVRARVPKTTTAATLFIKARCAAGSGETVNLYMRLNDTTDFAATTTVLNTGTQDIEVTGLSQSLVAGDYLALKIVTPAWVTNPTSVRFWASLYCE